MNILEKIVSATTARVEQQKKHISIEELTASDFPKREAFIFEKSINKKEIAFICEVKKASPSKGIISKDFPYEKIAIDYEKAGASALSILTEPDFFMGDNKYLSTIRNITNLPLLRKDFIIDPYQIIEAKTLGADAILLICRILSDAQLKEYILLADSLGLTCLVEAHNSTDIARSIASGARVIGVNNRDLKTFIVDIANSIRLRDLVPPEVLFVSESGISSREDIEQLAQRNVNAVLVGEYLMIAPNKKLVLDELRGITND